MTSMWAEEWPPEGLEMGGGESEGTCLLLNSLWLGSEGRGKHAAKPLSNTVGQQRTESEMSTERRKNNAELGGKYLTEKEGESNENAERQTGTVKARQSPRAERA